MNITQFRQQYPMYNDMSDQEISDKLYNTYYSDMPRQAFDQRFGYATTGLGGAINKAAQFVAPVNVGRANFIGNLYQDIGNWANLPSLSQRGKQIVQQAPNEYGLSQPSFPQSLVEGLSQGAPYAAMVPATGTSILGNAAAGGVYGLTQTPDNPIGGALGSALGGAALAGVGKGIGSAASLIKYLKGGPLQQTANSIYQDISQNLDPNALNTKATQALIQNYSGLTNQARQDYSSLGNLISQRGYATFQHKPIAGIDVGTNLKYMQIPAETQQSFDSLLNPSSDMSPIKSGLQDQINEYQKAPTYQNAHALQSEMGLQAAQLTKGLSPTSNANATAAALNQARNQIKSDISNSFIANGDQDLADQYQGLTDHFRDNIAPYRNVKPIFRAINGEAHPSNLPGLLTRNDSTSEADVGDLQVLKNHIAQNPEISGNILAQQMKNVAKKDVNGNYIVDPDKFAQSWANMPENIKQIASPQIQSTMDDYLTQYNKLNNLQNLAQKTKKEGVKGLLGLALLHFGLHL